jgi:tRNA threonylcarbamoyladenosine biosynthesis protein TsaE
VSIVRPLADADATRALGATLARALVADATRAPCLVTLSGDLGAGKTTLVAGMLAEMGHRGPVRSPTYTLLESYELAERDLHHCDLYRLRHPDELEDLGLRDLRQPGSVLLVEWPERAGDRLGAADLALHLTYAEGERRSARLEAGSALGRRLLAGC